MRKRKKWKTRVTCEWRDIVCILVRRFGKKKKIQRVKFESFWCSESSRKEVHFEFWLVRWSSCNKMNAIRLDLLRLISSTNHASLSSKTGAIVGTWNARSILITPPLFFFLNEKHEVEILCYVESFVQEWAWVLWIFRKHDWIEFWISTYKSLSTFKSQNSFWRLRREREKVNVQFRATNKELRRDNWSLTWVKMSSGVRSPWTRMTGVPWFAKNVSYWFRKSVR